jgi:hypothetical protein
VARRRLELVRSELLCGWDSSPAAHHHAVVIGARIGPQVRIYAGLVAEETGFKQFLDAYVLPWFGRRASWALTTAGGELLLHRYDPAMEPAEGGDYEENGIRRIRRALGGSFRPGASDGQWAHRAQAMHALLNLSDGQGEMALQIDPTEDTALLRRALAHEWYFAMTRAGQVVRDLPMKPNHPWEDLGDAFCYFSAGVAPSRPASARRPRKSYQAKGAGDFNPYILASGRSWGGRERR